MRVQVDGSGRCLTGQTDDDLTTAGASLDELGMTYVLG
jgi:hypothetical protein